MQVLIDWVPMLTCVLKHKLPHWTSEHQSYTSGAMKEGALV